MVPGVLALAACVMGVAYALLKKNPYLCIPFGVGGLASLYFIYLGYEYKDLQSLHNSSKSLKQTNGDLEARVREFSARNGELHTEIGQLAQNRETLQREVGTLQETNSEQHRALETQKELNRQLQQRTEEIQVGLGRMQTQLAAGEGNLDDLRSVLTGFESERIELQEIRDQLVKILEPIKPEEYRKACEAMSGLEARIQTARNALPELEGLVTEQRRMKNEYATLLKQISTLFEQLRSREEKAASQLGEKVDAFSAIEGRLKELLERASA